MNIQVKHDSPRLPYDAAWLYCACLYHDGYSNWRLPTHKEYMSHPTIAGWHQDDEPNHLGKGIRWEIFPVRDIDDN